MILFETIRWKNFLSTGNHFTEVNFTKTENTLIIGNNGAGKSTILDALTFVLFGKSFRNINKPQLTNSINEKDCLVEIEFKISSSEFKIRRGIKPSIFEIYKNGELFNQDASSSEQQKWFEQSVLKMNFKSFTQIVILGSSNFVPFMQLSATNRREVIEDLLDIKIFSSMTNIVKEKIRSIRDDVRTLTLKKESLQDKVRMQNDFIQEIESRSKEDITTKKGSITTLMEEVSEYMDQNSKTQVNIESRTKEQEKVIGAADKLSKLNTLKGQITQKVTTITEEHKFFTENTVCPTCHQDIEEEFRVNRISDVQNRAKELKDGYVKLEETIKFEKERERQFNILSKEITKLTHGISQNNTRIASHQRRIQDLESEIQRITDQLQNSSTEYEKLTKFQEDLENSDTNLSEKKETIAYYDFTQSLLKDSGVKSKIIQKYLPLINKQVNRYLQMMDFYINFTLDEEFNESIQSPIHENFSYTSFSEGERQRIDLALLFTWREVAKFKNSTNTNLLIMDEIFDSSLDGFGVEEFLKIVKYVIEDSNTFIISHKTDLHDKFDNVIKFEKFKGFSRIVP
jgi:DNA repair exonuclease SbcCD ATPase subunit